MKKKYVNLKIEVVEVQLSDCIAGSNITSSMIVVNPGSSEIREVEVDVTFSKW